MNYENKSTTRVDIPKSPCCSFRLPNNLHTDCICRERLNNWEKTASCCGCLYMQLSIGPQTQSVIKISFDISLLECLCITLTQDCFVSLPQPERIYYILFWCLHFVLRRLQKKASVCVCVCVCVCVWERERKHTEIERCSDSIREVHVCEMKPIITGWETGIVHPIDKSLSVTSAILCQRPVFPVYPPPPPQMAVHPLLQHDNTMAALSW